MPWTMYPGQPVTAPTVPPGRGIVRPCPDCRGAGEGCTPCEESGKTLMRTCPRCGDPAFDFADGISERNGMVCRLGCGYRWGWTDPEWLLQRLPAATV